MNNEYLLFLDFQRIERQIERTYGHHAYGADGAERLRCIAHEERENRSAEQTHDHQTGYLILLLRLRFECLREDDREDIRVTETNECDTRIEHSLRLADTHQHHRYHHHQSRDGEESLARYITKDERTAEAADGTEDEIERSGKRRLMQRPTKTLHEQFRRRSIRTYVNTHMAHDAQEAEQHERTTKQLEAVRKTRCLALNRLFLNFGHIKENSSQHTNDTIDDEDDTE